MNRDNNCFVHKADWPKSNCQRLFCGAPSELPPNTIIELPTTHAEWPSSAAGLCRQRIWTHFWTSAHSHVNFNQLHGGRADKQV